MKADYFTIVINNLRSRKRRSYLTIIGIVIGIVALFTLITLGQGLQNAIGAQFDKFGTDRLFISAKQAGFGGAPSGTGTLTQKDLETLEKINMLDYVSAVIMQPLNVEFNNKKEIIFVRGISTENIERAFSDVDMNLAFGRFINEKDKYSAVIGYDTAMDLFDKQIRINNKIEIEDKKFSIVGIVEEQGNADDDTTIYIPLETAREILDDPEGISALTATVKKGFSVEEAQKKIEKELERARDNENFVVTNPSQLREQLGQILGIVNLILIGIAMISLLVGGIGIMNSMYTSVLERTRDIGVMKAIGATNSDILSLFVIESGLLGIIGGAIGVGIGVLISLIVNVAVQQAGIDLLKIQIDPRIVLLALGFAFFIGLFSGILPAIRASKLKPVEALRYE